MEAEEVMPKKTKISVIIPAKDEPYLLQLVDEIHQALAYESHEILVQSEQSLGYAVQCGLRKAKGEVVVIMDGDGSHNPKYIAPMLSYLNGKTDLVVGSRYFGHGRSEDSLIREITSRFFCLMARLLLKLHVKDVMSGFLVGKREAFRFTFARGYKFGLELIMENRNRVAEHPIVFEKRKMGRSKASPFEVLRILKLIVQLRSLHLRFRA